MRCMSTLQEAQPDQRPALWFSPSHLPMAPTVSATSSENSVDSETVHLIALADLVVSPKEPVSDCAEIPEAQRNTGDMGVILIGRHPGPGPGWVDWSMTGPGSFLRCCLGDLPI